MFIFLIVIIAIIAILLSLLILLQSGKGGGLAGIAAGGAATQILGARQAPDILEKASWALGAAFIVLCILTNFAIPDGEESESVIQQRARGSQTEQQAPPVLPQPGGQQGPQGQAPSQQAPPPGVPPENVQPAPEGGQ